MKLLLLSSLLLLSGCVQTVIETPSGVKFWTTRFLWSGGVSEASFTNRSGDSLVIKGYKSDAEKTMEAIASGVVQGMSKSAKP